MLINNILFLHPGKTGGTSIEHALLAKYTGIKFTDLNPKKPYYDKLYGFCPKGKIYLHHADLRFLEQEGYLKPEYEKIASVRNPFNRLLSAYYYNSIDKKFTFENFVMNHLQEYVDKNEDYAVNHFCPQMCYVDSETTLIHLENIREDCKKLGLEVPVKQHAKTVASKRHKKYLDAYTEDMKKIVTEIYEDDFKNLGYHELLGNSKDPAE